jgi:hypothetical protein
MRSASGHGSAGSGPRCDADAVTLAQDGALDSLANF